MKRINLLSLALIALVACSKSSDPAATPSAGCTVTFKGTSYPLNTATCSTIGAEQFLTGLNLGVATSPTLSLGKGTGVGDYITFFTNSSDVNTLYSSVGLVTAPTITITNSGKTWTFSGTLENSVNSSDSGTITGTCTCTL